ncbi:hypothetical protein N0V88_002726 [Collariella sp. IMI 366227]|nr:hypothetical protein N0V88_002726 [Collariella sp. IMI 366227]
MAITGDLHHDGQPFLTTKDQPSDKPATTGHSPRAPSIPSSAPEHVSVPGPPPEQHINQTAPAGQARRRGASFRVSRSATSASSLKTGLRAGRITTITSSSSAQTLTKAKAPRQSSRRRSTATNSSMDLSQYGAASSSPSMRGFLQRPMPLHPAAVPFTTRITPKTGRVSKAKKGLPVHVCDICRPPKVQTLPADAGLKAGCCFPFDSVPSPTPNPAAGSQDFSQLNSPPRRTSSAYSTRRGSSQDFHGAYTLSPSLSVVNPAQSSSLSASYQGNLADYQPRTAPPPIYVVTRGLEVPTLQPANLPELHDPSGWPSSASDSTTYSTPASEIPRNPRPWTHGQQSPAASWTPAQGLSAYLSTAPRGLQNSAPAVEGLPALHSPFVDQYSNTQPSEQAFRDMLSMPSPMGFSTAGPAAHHHHSLSASSSNTVRMHHHHHHSNSVSSVRGRSPSLISSSHTGDLLAVSTPPLATHLDPMASHERQKGMMMEAHQDLMEQKVAMSALDILGGLAMDYAGGSTSNMASIGPDHGNQNSSILAELDLAMGGNCAIPITASMTIPLPGPVRAAIPRYLEAYWVRDAPVLPLVHRQSFEAAPEDVLRCAMAAIATQHLGSAEDRNRGNQLHEYAWNEVKRIPQWTLQTMQAILLCEHFARFRGRKAVTRPSKPFESLYLRALHQNSALVDHAMLDGPHLTLHDRWRNWVDTEARRRLFAICLYSDGHAAIYHQQRRVQDGEPVAPQLIPLLDRSTRLWDAPSAEEWANALAADPGALQLEHVPPLEHLTPEFVAGRSLVDRMLIVSAVAQHLPRRQRLAPAASISASNSPTPELDHAGGPFNPDQHAAFLRHSPSLPYHHEQPELNPQIDAEHLLSTLFPSCPITNTYLALHHTPLRDLLAISGDSWVFSQKVFPATSFKEHQRRLRQWVTSSSEGIALGGLSVVRATVYAARAILGLLARHADNVEWAPGGDMSDYWALYVMHHQKEYDDQETMAFLRLVSRAQTAEDFNGVVAPAVAGVVALVRRVLEKDCVGARSRLFVDAVGVLGKMEG